jgi:protein TonB
MPTLAIDTSAIRYSSRPQRSLTGIALVVAAHLGLLGILASLELIPNVAQISTLMVELLPSPTAEIAPPKSHPTPSPTPPKPMREQQRQAAPQPKMIAAASEALAATTETRHEREAPPAPAAPAPTAAITLTQPRFDADYLSNPPPTYPPLSRRMGEEGKVQLRVFVDGNGRASQIELKTSSGSPRLDQAAQDAVWRWKFVPARRGDEAIAAWVLVPIVFTLKN